MTHTVSIFDGRITVFLSTPKIGNLTMVLGAEVPYFSTVLVINIFRPDRRPADSVH